MQHSKVVTRDSEFRLKTTLQLQQTGHSNKQMSYHSVISGCRIALFTLNLTYIDNKQHIHRYT